MSEELSRESGHQNMARLNEGDTITDQLDNLPKDELCAKKKILELADNVRYLYQHWKNHPEEFKHDHERRNRRRDTLLSIPSHEIKCEDPQDQIHTNLALDLQEFTDWFVNNRADIALRFTSATELSESVNENPELWSKFIRYLSNSLHYADLHITSQESEIQRLLASNEDLTAGVQAQFPPHKKQQ